MLTLGTPTELTSILHLFMKISEKVKNVTTTFLRFMNMKQSKGKDYLVLFGGAGAVFPLLFVGLLICTLWVLTPPVNVVNFAEVQLRLSAENQFAYKKKLISINSNVPICSFKPTKPWILPVLPEWDFLYAIWGVPIGIGGGSLTCNCFSTSEKGEKFSWTPPQTTSKMLEIPSILPASNCWRANTSLSDITVSLATVCLYSNHQSSKYEELI